MGRAKTQRKRAFRAPSVEIKPSPIKGIGPTRKSGRERPDAPTAHPQNIADPVARVIRTRT